MGKTVDGATGQSNTGTLSYLWLPSNSNTTTWIEEQTDPQGHELALTKARILLGG